jgi:hypothetical protein
MCREVEELGEALARVVGALDPDSVPLPEATELWSSFDGIERLAGAAKAARPAGGGVGAWERAGCRSAAELLAARGGTSVGEAKRELETSARLLSAPATEAALRSGELSGARAGAIADAAVLAPGAERGQVETVGRKSPRELRDDCARVRAAVDPDPETTCTRIRAARRLRSFRDPEGAWVLAGRGTVDAGARVEAALAPIIDECFRSARSRGEREPREAYAFDTLVELARRARERAGVGEAQDARFLALLRLDVEALVRGAVEGEERCALTGILPCRCAWRGSCWARRC